MITARDISLRIGTKEILQPLSVHFRPGQITAIIGKNGSGKSSLLKVLAGLKPASSGSIHYGDTEISSIDALGLAQHRAFLQQRNNLNLTLPVEDVVELGSVHRMISPTKVHFLEFGIQDLRNQLFNTLSGGEQQRVLMAMVAWQLKTSTAKEKYLFLDEPLNNLDANHQQDLMSRARMLANSGVGVVVVLHDLDKALQHCDTVIAIEQGKLVACGNPEEILNEEFVWSCFGVRAQRIRETDGTPRLLETNSGINTPLTLRNTHSLNNTLTADKEVI